MKLIIPAMAAFLVAGGMFTAAHAQTLLTLNVTSNDSSAPDEISASLAASARAPSAAAAQNNVNELAATSLHEAKKLPALNVHTGGYNVYETTPPGQNQNPKQVFEASQTIELQMPAANGVPPQAFLNLVGKLQQLGLQLNGLQGELSAAGQKAARARATQAAIHELQAEAGQAADALGEKVAGIKTLNIEATSPPLLPGRMMMSMAAAPQTAPQAAPGPVNISVSITATVALTPHTP